MAGFKEYQMLFQLNASVGSGFSSTFTTGQSTIQSLQNTINSLNKTQSDISSYEKQQSAIEKTRAKLELYQYQLQNLQNAQASSSKEEAELKNAIAAKEAQITSTTEKLDQQNAALSETGKALRDAGVDTSNLAGESERLKTETAQVAQAQKEEAEAAQKAGNSLKDAMTGAAAAIAEAKLVEGLNKIYGALSDCSQAAAQFETSMAGVKRTVGGDDAFITQLGENFKELSTQIPISATDLANIATTAGQLGIHQESVKQFTTVMAQLATTTDLSADSAATMLAQFANITGVTDYERLGSTVASLGDATATTASKVVEMSQGMAAAANIAGMSATDTLAIAAAVGSLGIEASSGSTSMSTLISTLYKATETGDKLEDFASVAGMTAEEFKTAWGTDAVGALDSFIQGLNDTERNGKSAVVILDELGIKNVRQTKAILGLASAGDLLSNTVAQANGAWSSNTALAEKAGIMYNTTEAKMTMLQNAANNVKVAVGDALNPALSGAADAVTGLLQPITEWIAQNPVVVQMVTAFIGVLGAATAGILAYTTVTKLAAAASVLLGAAMPFKGILVAAGAIAGLVGLIGSMSTASAEATESFSDLDSEYDNMIDQFAEQKKVVDLVDSYKDLNQQTENLQSLMKGDFSTEITFTPKGPEDSGKLSPDDFVSDRTVKLTAETGKTLAANDFLTGASAVVKLTPEQANFLSTTDFISGTDGEKLKVHLTPTQAEIISSDSFVLSPYIGLTPEQKEYLKSDDFINGEKIIELTPEAVSRLATSGLVEGTTVELTGTVLERMAADGFLEGNEVTLTARSIAMLQASEFMLDGEVTITGAAGNTLSAADFGLSNTTLTYIATMQPKSYDDVKKRAQELQAEVLKTDAQLSSAQTKLTAAKEQATSLQNAIDGEKNKKTKSALQERLDNVLQSISDYTYEVDRLEVKQAQLSKDFEMVGTAAQELQGKEEALVAVKQALAGASDQVTDASEGTAAAFDQEAAAAEQNALSKMAELRILMFGNLNKQVANYTNSVRSAAVADSAYADVQQRQATISKFYQNGTDSLNASYQSLLATLDDLENAEGFTPTDTNYQNLVNEAKTLISIMSGGSADLEGFGTYAMGAWAQSFGYLTNVTTDWNQVLNNLDQELVNYQKDINNANGTQDAFIQNLVDGMVAGAVTADDVRNRITEALSDEENAQETVNAIMAEVTEGYAEAIAAKEAAAEASEDNADATEEEAKTVEDLLSQMQALKEAYDETYNAALTSMNGQFNLFERVNFQNKGHNGGIADMTKALQEQQKYVQEYADNYNNASTAFEQAGVDSETANAILSSLSDGSTESAEYLKTLATATDAELKELASQYESLNTSKEQYASTVAEIQTGFSETMTQLSSDLQETVAKMDFSSDAAKNAKASMDSFISSIEGYSGRAQTAAAKVAAAAAKGLKFQYTPMEFASGTPSAPSGLAIVGEEGPELMSLNGGEAILDAQKTAKVMESLSPKNATPVEAIGGTVEKSTSNNYNVQFSPNFNVTGSTNADEIRGVLEEQTANMREQIESILNDISEDRNRRTLA